MGIDSAAIEAWWRQAIPGAALPLRFERVAGGRSNLTFRVRDGAGGEWALRRPPLGERLASAHDVAREHRIISALSATEVPVPPPAALCEDESVTGAPFYVAGFVPGRVLRSTGDGGLAPDEGERRRIGERLVATLADLHALDPATAGLGDLGRPDGYIERQLRRWQRQWEKTRSGDRGCPSLRGGLRKTTTAGVGAVVEAVHGALAAAIPPQRTAIAHGDYRLDNVILDPGGGIAAVVDWELCTLGDPLADLGLLLVYWAPPGEDLIPRFDPATRLPGFPSRRQACELYAELTGAEVEGIGYYVAFSLWRVAIILEGVRVRYAAGQYGGEEWDDGGAAEAIGRIAEAAEAVLRGAVDPLDTLVRV